MLITEDLAHQRLDKVLSQNSNFSSRSQASQLITNGHVLLLNKPVKPSHITKLGELFTVEIPQVEVKVSLEPYKFKLDILFEDDDVIVINKPSGLVVHPAAGHYSRTLVNALLYHTKILASGTGDGRPGIVHRIDKDTSGLMVVCKTDLALRELSKQFAKKAVHRIYWAVCFGHFRYTNGTITSFLRRHPSDRKKFASEKLHAESVPRGKKAITHYSVVQHNVAGFSLVHCKLETGRTHQIRVHLSENSHPILGDPMYCSSHRKNGVKSVRLRKVVESVPHLMLHAAELGFTHPRTGEYLEFKTPWPKELIPTIKALGFDNL